MRNARKVLTAAMKRAPYVMMSAAALALAILVILPHMYYD